jgi:hypothetical protein
VSLSGLIACVLACGLGLAALRNASPTWAGSMLLLTLGLLAVAVLGVVYRREERRAWWLGFALFGWGFAALVLAPWSRPEALPSTGLLDRLYVRVSPTKVVALETYGPPSDGRLGDSLVVSNDVPPHAIPATAGPADTVFLVGTVGIEAFRSIGHCLLTVLVASLGGGVARWFHATGGSTIRSG